MDIQNLGGYVREGVFLQDIQQLPFDAILWEKFPANDVVGKKYKSTHDAIIQHETFANLGYDMRPQGTIIQWMGKYKHVLLVLDTLSTKDIASLLPALPISTVVTIWNIGAGVTGMSNKHTPDWHDLQVMMPYFAIYEPLDVYHLHQFAQLTTNTYVRIPQDELPEKLFDETHNNLYKRQIISFQEFGYTGTKGLIITFPGLLPEVTQALQYIQTQQGYGYDLCVVTILDDIYTAEELQEFSHADEIIVFHDQAEDTALENWITSIKKQLPHSIKVKYHHPEYASLTTFLSGYMFSQAKFDAEALAQWLHTHT